MKLSTLFFITAHQAAAFVGPKLAFRCHKSLRVDGKEQVLASSMVPKKNIVACSAYRHDYERDPRDNDYAFDQQQEHEVNILLEERVTCKKRRMFEEADDIRDILKDEYGVFVDDRSRTYYTMGWLIVDLQILAIQYINKQVLLKKSVMM